MKRVKKLFPALLALALLTGCSRDYYTLETTIRVPTGDDIPVTSPAQSISAPAVVTEGTQPSEDYALPAEKTDMSVWNMDTTALLAETEDGTGAFYGTPDETALIQWGGSLAEFDWNFVTPRRVPPQVWCFDADGDGQDELVVSCYWGSGTGVSIEGLHIVEKSADGTLVDYAFPEELWGERMFSLLDTAVINDRLYGILGEELVDITRHLPEGLSPADVRGLGTGSIANFSIETYGDGGGSLCFGGCACLDAERYYYCYVADISAAVSYADGVFTLSDFHLNSFD